MFQPLGENICFSTDSLQKTELMERWKKLCSSGTKNVSPEAISFTVSSLKETDECRRLFEHCFFPVNSDTRTDRTSPVCFRRKRVFHQHCFIFSGTYHMGWIRFRLGFFRTKLCWSLYWSDHVFLSQTARWGVSSWQRVRKLVKSSEDSISRAVYFLFINLFWSSTGCHTDPWWNWILCVESHFADLFT